MNDIRKLSGGILPRREDNETVQNLIASLVTVGNTVNALIDKIDELEDRIADLEVNEEEQM